MRIGLPSRWSNLLRGNVGSLALISFLNDVASEMVYPLLPVFLVGTLGAGPAFLGIIEGAAASAGSLVKYGGGWLSDRLRRRKMLIVVGYALAGVARPFLALVVVPWHVLGLRLADRVGKGVRTAPRDALLTDSVPVARRGLAFGLHRAADHAGSVVGPVLAAAVLLVYPGRLRIVFALAALPAAVAVWVAIRRVRERVPAMAVARQHPDHAAPFLGVTDRRFRAFLGVLVLFTLGNASDAFLLLRAQGLGVPVIALPLIWAVFHASKMTWSIPGGSLSDRVGPVRVLIAGWLLHAIVYLGFAVATGPSAAWALFLVYGLFYGLTESPEKALVAKLAPSCLRGRAFGAYHAAVGVAALPASVLFGALWRSFGASAAFLTGAGLAGLAAICLMFMRLPAEAS